MGEWSAGPSHEVSLVSGWCGLEMRQLSEWWAGASLERRLVIGGCGLELSGWCGLK